MKNLNPVALIFIALFIAIVLTNLISVVGDTMQKSYRLQCLKITNELDKCFTFIDIETNP